MKRKINRRSCEKAIRKPILVCLFLITISGWVWGQVQTPLDIAYIKCEYKVICFNDTITFDRFMEEHFILQIGRNCTKYFSKDTEAYLKLKADPEAWDAYTQELVKGLEDDNMLNFKPLARGSALIIYGNYPENSRTIVDAVFRDYYFYEEEQECQDWKIMPDSIETILGYECQKAVCNFRGRVYEAWFSYAIPVSCGPWKLCGLPGLILKAQDSKGHYTFEISGLEKVKEEIQFSRYADMKLNKTERELLLQRQYKLIQIGKAGYMSMSHGTNVPSTSNSNAKYDLLERDYRKK